MMEAFTEGWYVQRETKKRDAERAVIEAAKALVEAEAMDFDGGEPLTSAEQALVTAVEALQEVEGGEDRWDDPTGLKDIEYVQLADAVIEAAKAWLHSASPRDERDHVYCRHRLGEAIETLEAAEEGEE